MDIQTLVVGGGGGGGSGRGERVEDMSINHENPAA